ncbi:MAG: RT0821/Lpp0805 family surface protein [Pseudomonadota bacterium]
MSTLKSSITAGALALTMAVAGCANQGGGGVGGTGISKQTVGAGAGAVGGALIGSTIGSGSGRTAAIIVGGLLGALAGSEIGRTMDENDRLRAEQNRQLALETAPSGQPTSWNNPDSGYGGSITPRPAYETSGGEVCREYTETIRIDGRNETAVGVACRNADGTWRVVNS